MKFIKKPFDYWIYVARAAFLLCILLLLPLSAVSAVAGEFGPLLDGGQIAPANNVNEQMTMRDQPLPLQYAVSEAMGRSHSDYHILERAHELHAKTPSQKLSTTFGKEGIAVMTGDAELRMSLRAIGYGNQLQLVAAAQPQIQIGNSNVEESNAGNNRVTYRRGNLTEWYVNGPLGLQQGFTLAERPPKAHPTSNQRLKLELALSTGWQSELAADGRSLTLSGPHNTRLSYGGLLVFDATGQSLPARFQSTDGALTIAVNDRDAQYPLTIDPVIQQAYLKPSAPGRFDEFGYSVAISGDTLVVGAPFEDGNGSGPGNNSMDAAGAVYVFVRNGNSWSQQAYLKASNPDMYDSFGHSVAISGDTLVVTADGEKSNGSSQDDNSMSFAGAAYVFVRNGNSWSQQAYLKASNPGEYDYFGRSVAISGDTLVVGAPFEDGNGSAPSDNSVDFAGAAYVFVRSGNSWSQQAYLKASNPEEDDEFGHSVTISGNTIVVGALGEKSNGTSEGSASYRGAAYVFVHNGNSWSQQAYLKASNTGIGNQFAHSVAISGDTLVVGATYANSNDSGQDQNSVIYGGAAYVFVRSGNSWSQQAYLKASNPEEHDQFGHSVTYSGDTLVVTALKESSNGSSEGDNSARDAGAAYVFVRSGNSWSQQAYLKASNPDAYDEFGYSAAISGDTLVIGARREDSSGSSPSDNSMDGTGAVYIYDTEPNQSPVATHDAYDTDEDTVLNMAAPGILDNDSDPDSDPLTAILDTTVSNGTLTLNSDGSFVYTPNAGFSGTDSFTYYATDGTADSNVATVTITVRSVNYAPITTNDAYATDEDTPLNIAAPGVLDNDTDGDDDALTAVLNSGPSNGTLTLNLDGSLDYMPYSDFFGTDSFTYHATDGSADSNVATVTITVNAVDDAPTPTNTAVATATPTFTNTPTPIPTPTNTTVSTPCDPTPGNLVHNGNFDDDTDSWHFYTESSGNFSMVSPAYQCVKAARLQVNGSTSNIQLYQRGINLQAGKQYQLRFAAYSSSGHDLRIYLHDHRSPYTNYGLKMETVNLTTDWQQFSIPFMAEGFSGSVTDARLRFWLAPYAQTGDLYWIDDVQLTEVGGSSPIITPTPSPSGSTPSPTNTPIPTPGGSTPTPANTPIGGSCDSAAGNILSNGDFETDHTSWQFYTNSSGSFNTQDPAYSCAQAARIQTNGIGSNVQLYQRGIRLEANTQYRLSFAAYSSSGADMSVYLHNNKSPYQNYGLNISQINLGTGWQLYTVDFATAGFSGMVNDARLRFWLAPYARSGDVYWIDAVSIIKVTSRSSLANNQDRGPIVGTTADGLLIGLTKAEFDPIVLGTIADGNEVGAAEEQEQLFLPFTVR